MRPRTNAFHVSAPTALANIRKKELHLLRNEGVQGTPKPPKKAVVVYSDAPFRLLHFEPINLTMYIIYGLYRPSVHTVCSITLLRTAEPNMFAGRTHSFDSNPQISLGPQRFDRVTPRQVHRCFYITG